VSASALVAADRNGSSPCRRGASPCESASARAQTIRYMDWTTVPLNGRRLNVDPAGHRNGQPDGGCLFAVLVRHPSRPACAARPRAVSRSPSVGVRLPKPDKVPPPVLLLVAHPSRVLFTVRVARRETRHNINTHARAFAGRREHFRCVARAPGRLIMPQRCAMKGRLL
jgi:hypothetical protein